MSRRNPIYETVTGTNSETETGIEWIQIDETINCNAETKCETTRLDGNCLKTAWSTVEDDDEGKNEGGPEADVRCSARLNLQPEVNRKIITTHTDSLQNLLSIKNADLDGKQHDEVHESQIEILTNTDSRDDPCGHLLSDKNFDLLLSSCQQKLETNMLTEFFIDTEFAQPSTSNQSMLEEKISEDFTICRKCLLNRNDEFKNCKAPSSNALQQSSQMHASKEICICPGNAKLCNRMPAIVVEQIFETENCFGMKEQCDWDLTHKAFKKSICHINDLPHEVLLRIFAYLSPCELCRYVAPVCATWLPFARDSTLWAEITDKEFKDVSSELLVKVVTSWCSLLRVIEFNSRIDMTLEDFAAVFSHCPLIENISFACCSQLNDNILKLLSHYCHGLKCVNLEGCPVSDASLMYFIGNPIQSMNLSHCGIISDEGVIFLAKNFKNLKFINLDGIQWITQTSIYELVKFHADHLVEIVLDGEGMVDDAIRILSRCKSTRKFSLSFCDMLSDFSLEWMKQFNNLDHLQLKKGLNFSMPAICDFLTSLKNLHGAGLKYLNFAECHSLSDECMHAISISCPNLQILNLSWCWDVTDDGINFMFDSCNKIKELHLSGMHLLYGLPFRRIHAEMPKLVFLDLQQCNTISDDLLAELADQVCRLTILNYYGDVVKASLSYWNLESKCSPGLKHTGS